MAAHLGLYMPIMFGKSGLSRAEREAIGVVVSANNDCAYCVRHHVEALKHYIEDEETLNMLSTADGLETLEPRLVEHRAPRGEAYDCARGHDRIRSRRAACRWPVTDQ